jgi:hypothetical protein
LVITMAMAVGSRASSAQTQAVFDSVRTRTGYCHVWQLPPGGSNFPEDASYRRCALDRRPTRITTPPPPAPRYGFNANSSFLVVVSADGTVDQERTRGYSRGTDTIYYRQALETIKRWRFEPGMRQGKPVRSAFEVQFSSDSRVDTLPARLEWQYREGAEIDTMQATWLPEAPLPPFAPDQADSIQAALLRHLVRMQVIIPNRDKLYCLLPEGRDSAAHARQIRLAARAIPALARTLMPYGCERMPGTVRVVLPQIFRTENGRAVVYPSGDFLPNWPPGFTGRSWRAWRARCVLELRGVGADVAAADCDVSPTTPRDDRYAAYDSERRWPVTADYRDGDSVRITVFATTTDAFLTDTLKTVVRSLPRLDDYSVRDAHPPCGGWSMHTTETAELYVVSGDPTSNSMHITRASTRIPPVPRDTAMRCGPQEPRMKEFAAFLLGDLGGTATKPLTLCFSRCARPYVLDPARHTMAERAQVVFRPSELRADTRLGDYLMFRIVVEPTPASMLPLVVVQSGNKPPTLAWIGRRAGPNSWDYTVLRETQADDEVRIYLIVTR